jgi:hypothetical protein
MTTQAISGAAVCAGVVVAFIVMLMVAAKAGDKQALRDRIYYELGAQAYAAEVAGRNKKHRVVVVMPRKV